MAGRRVDARALTRPARPRPSGAASLRAERDRLILEMIRSRRKTREDIATMFGLSRRAVYDIEERAQPSQRVPRKLTRPDNRLRAEGGRDAV